jgi:hypothetical protein
MYDVGFYYFNITHFPANNFLLIPAGFCDWLQYNYLIEAYGLKQAFVYKTIPG